MYVCISMYIYIYIYICMYVCMDVCIYILCIECGWQAENDRAMCAQSSYRNKRTETDDQICRVLEPPPFFNPVLHIFARHFE